jgi:hypothetical protein
MVWDVMGRSAAMEAHGERRPEFEMGLSRFTPRSRVAPEN